MPKDGFTVVTIDKKSKNRIKTIKSREGARTDAETVRLLIRDYFHSNNLTMGPMCRQAVTS